MIRSKNQPLRRPCAFTVYIPGRYTVRSSKAERVLWPLLSIPSLVLARYCLLGLIVSGGLLVLSVFWMPNATTLVFLATLLVLLAALALLLFCPILAVKRWKDCLTVDGETLILRRWPRKGKTFTFSDIAWVQASRSRGGVLLRDREGRTLCRLGVSETGMDILMADLRSRRAFFVERPGQMTGDPLPPLSPGPQKEEQTLDLPADVPGWYHLAYGRGFSLIFWALLVFSAALVLLCVIQEEMAGILCVSPFGLMAVLGLFWLRAEGMEVLNDRIRRRGFRNRDTSIAFSDVAAVRISTTVTGLGPISGLQLLDPAGKVLLRPGAWMEGTDLLLADLIRRGVPFTY